MAKELSLQFERASEDIEEIIGIIPHWIIRWGITVALFLLVCVLLVSNFIRYPDVIMATSELVAEEQPFKISWYRSEENITYQSRVEDNQLVKKGDTLLIENDLRTMKSKVVLSPLAGQVFITKGYKNNAEKQTIWVSQKINGYKVVFLLSNSQSGKVRVGQKAQISLSEYPRNEFGYLEGTISNIIPVKIEGSYRAYVSLNNKTTTNTGYVIPDQPSFSGTAEILTNEKSVFQRIFSY